MWKTAPNAVPRTILSVIPSGRRSRPYSCCHFDRTTVGVADRSEWRNPSGSWEGVEIATVSSFEGSLRSLADSLGRDDIRSASLSLGRDDRGGGDVVPSMS
jgi:hypothetical protein